MQSITFHEPDSAPGAASPPAASAGVTRRPHGWAGLRSHSVAFVLILLGFGAFAYTALASRQSLQQVLQYTAERDESLKTLLLIEQVHRLLFEIESGQRHLAARTDTERQFHHQRARLKLQGAHSQLNASLAAASGQTHPTETLDSLIGERLAQLGESLSGPRRDEVSAVNGAVGPGASRRTMESIQAELERLRGEQSLRVERRSQEVSDVKHRTRTLNAVLPLIGALLMALAVAKLFYERRRRDAAEAALRQVNSTLEQQVSQRTGELQRALVQIQSFASELDRSIEAERRRLARELHDQFGQVATALRLLVMGLHRDHPRVPDDTVQEMTQLIDEAIGMARRISAALRPPLLDDLGLAAAAEHFANTVQRQSGLRVVCDVSDDTVLTPHQANQLFRIMQEATTNVLRHARASELRISACVDEDLFKLEIEDDGVGPGSVRADASGLRNMRERAQLIGAALHFGAGDPHGTRVAVQVPVDPAGDHPT